MAEFKPGIVAVATVRGVQGVRVMRMVESDPDVAFWTSVEKVNGTRVHFDDNVTDIRELVVLDLDPVVWASLVDQAVARVRASFDDGGAAA